MCTSNVASLCANSAQKKKIANRRGMFTIMPKRDEYSEKSESYSNLTKLRCNLKNFFAEARKM